MIKACIFDMDGVIVDSAKYHYLAWKQLANELGIEFTKDDNELLKGLSRVDSLEKILQKGSMVLDNDTKLSLMDKKNGWYLEYVSQMQPDEVLPGVVAFLDELKANGIKIALGSSSKNAVRILKAVGLTTYFDSVIDGTKVTFSKPDPEVFLKGAAECDVTPAEAVVFEDAVSGVEAGKKGGFYVVGIGDPSVLTKADFVVPGFENFNLATLNAQL